MSTPDPLPSLIKSLQDWQVNASRMRELWETAEKTRHAYEGQLLEHLKHLITSAGDVVSVRVDDKEVAVLFREGRLVVESAKARIEFDTRPQESGGEIEDEIDEA